jgi:hypothetical protein
VRTARGLRDDRDRGRVDRQQLGRDQLQDLIEVGSRIGGNAVSSLFVGQRRDSASGMDCFVAVAGPAPQ